MACSSVLLCVQFEEDYNMKLVPPSPFTRHTFPSGSRPTESTAPRGGYTFTEHLLESKKLYRYTQQHTTFVALSGQRIMGFLNTLNTELNTPKAVSDYLRNISYVLWILSNWISSPCCLFLWPWAGFRYIFMKGEKSSTPITYVTEKAYLPDNTLYKEVSRLGCSLFSSTVHNFFNPLHHISYLYIPRLRTNNWLTEVAINSTMKRPLKSWRPVPF